MTDLQIKCFLETARRLSFSGAARALFISQPTISRQIAKLEEELTFELFQRNTKSVVLTEQGEILAESLFKIEGEWNHAMARAKNSLQKFSGSLTIGCTPHVKSNSHLSQMLSSFRELHPDIKIVKERSQQSKLIEGLNNDYYDAILIAGHDVEFLKDVVTEVLFRTRVGIVIYKSHPLFFKPDVTLADFYDSGFLRYNPTDIPLERDFVYNLCKDSGFTPKVIAEFTDFEEFLFSIEMGEGVAVVYEETEVISNMNLRFIPLNEDHPQKFLPMHLAKKVYNRSPAVEAFFSFARKYS
ncbi:MAG: LysR family transcriptional regulator [Oscillospiraceae bacterium]|nr:LysR family transcriptional regulator [Oscillospiraceae bacterium]